MLLREIELYNIVCSQCAKMKITFIKEDLALKFRFTEDDLEITR